MSRFVLAVSLIASVAVASPTAVLCVGNSLTYGYDHDATPYPARLESLLGVQVVNMGVGGDRLSTIVARWQSFAKPYPYKWLVAEGGTNDIHLFGSTGADAWTAMEAWLEEAEAAGLQIVLVKIPPRWGSSGWTGDMETERLDFNGRADTWAADHPNVRVINSDAVLGTGSPVALQVAYDSGDHLHLNGTGMQVLAQAIADAM